MLFLGYGGLSGATITLQGLLIGLFGTLCWSIGSVVSQRIALPEGIMRVACQMLTGGVFVAIVSAVIREPVALAAIQPKVILACGALVIGAILGYGSYMYLLGQHKISLATSYAYMNPVVAIALGALILRERVDAVEMIGIAIILSGVVFIWLGSARKAKA